MNDGSYRERVLQSFYANMAVLAVFIFVTMTLNSIVVGLGTVGGWVFMIAAWGLGVAFGKRRVSR